MNARRKIVVAMMMHETNTFSPVPTPLASFRPLSGQAAVEEFRDTNTQLGGFLNVAHEIGAEIIIPVAAGAHPSGRVETAAYEDMCGAIVGAIRNGCDAAFLALHGAMVAEDLDDGEGELLRRIRAVAPRLPIAVGLDFHSHMTAAMIDNATVVAGYRTYPHVDMGETGQRAGRTLVRALNGEVAPVMVWGSRPMMTSTLVHAPSRQPMKDVMSVIEEAMRQGLDDVVAGPICDPATVRRVVEAGTAAGVTLDLGGKVDMPQINLMGKPLTVTGKVMRITEGEFTVTGPMATGTRVRMGRTAVLDTGAMQIVISERRSEPFDVGVFTHCGIDPRRKKYVLIKSRQHFRAGFEPIARHIVMCDGDGCTSSDLRLFTYRKRPKPLYPFEDGGGS